MLLLLFCLTFAAEDSSYVLILRNNQKMTIKEPPACQGRTCTVVMKDGSKKLIPWTLIDRNRTAAYNEHLTQVRAKEEAARLAAEEEAAAKAEEEKAKKAAEPPKQIVLRDTSKLPKFDRSQNATSGAVAAAAPSGRLKDSRSREMSGTDEVYLSKETVKSYESYHLVDVEIRTQAGASVIEIKVDARVTFENEAPQTFKLTLPKTSLGSNEAMTANFRVKSSDIITKINYTTNFRYQTTASGSGGN